RYNPPSLHEPSAVSALLAAVLAYYSVSDVLATSMHAEVSAFYWGAQAPARLLFFFALTAWSLAARPGGLAGIATPPDAAQAASLAVGSPGAAEGGLGNGIVFSWAFVGILAWFWVCFFSRPLVPLVWLETKSGRKIFITLRDERRASFVQGSAQRARSD
ncbi:MAG: hypothetical protein LQ340_001755, partial [Diploschistes diacapsis]